MIRDKYLTFSVPERGWDKFDFTVDLESVATNTGKIGEYISNQGKKCKGVLYPISKARQLCRLIVQNADPNDFEVVSKFFEANPKLMKIWDEELRRSGWEEGEPS